MRRAKRLAISIIMITSVLGWSKMNITQEVNHIGSAVAIAECEDNSPENGYFMYCQTDEGDKLFVPMEDVLEGDAFEYKLIEGHKGKVVRVYDN